MTTWYAAKGDAFHVRLPRRGSSALSRVVWVALSDGRVLRAECFLDGEGKPRATGWFLESDDEGNPHRALPAEVQVLAWAEPEEPPAYNFNNQPRTRKRL